MAAAPSHQALLAAVQEQAGLIADLVATIPDDAFDRPTRAGSWTVAVLVTHLARVHSSVLDVLARPVTGPPELTARDYFGVARSYAPDVSRLAGEQAAGKTPVQLREGLAEACAAGVTALAETDEHRVVQTRGGAMTLRELTWTRLVEQVVHVLDLRAALLADEAQAWLSPSGMTLACRLIAERAVDAEPGGAVELRVPPRVAVQLGAGSKHTRGTPPNTVETDQVTFVELAAARISWADAVRTGRLRVKGDRADLSRLLPLL